jgi:hypothetical protein
MFPALTLFNAADLAAVCRGKYPRIGTFPVLPTHHHGYKPKYQYFHTEA